MKKNLIPLLIIIIIVVVGLIFWFQPNLLKVFSPNQESSVEELKQELNNLDLDNLDAEFEAVDQEIETL